MKLLKFIAYNYLFRGLIWFRHYRKIRTLNLNCKLGYNSFLNESHIEEYVTIYDDVNIYKCEIGAYTYIASNCDISNTVIGRFCSIGSGVKCGLGKHPTMHFVSTSPIFYSLGLSNQITFADKNYFQEMSSIHIGNDVWIGSNAMILDGVRIGNGAIIGAGAVVNKDVPDYAIYAGVPAKLIRYRFSESEIKFLLNDKWWDKPIQWLKNNFKLFHDIEKYKKFFV